MQLFHRSGQKARAFADDGLGVEAEKRIGRETPQISGFGNIRSITVTPWLTTTSAW